MTKYKVKFSTNTPDWDWIRQTPGRKGIWGDSQFFINKDIDECDFWFVYEDLPKNETVKCPPENTVLITGEPESVKKYNEKFLAQFGMIITSNRSLKHRNIIYSQQGLPWFVGANFKLLDDKYELYFNKDYDFFKNIVDFHKTDKISVVCSAKNTTTGHIARTDFIHKIKHHFGDKLDIYGHDFLPFNDKWDAIFPYKYHLVIENCSVDDYWTEKLSDAFIGFSFPIYFGCKNIFSYFSEKSLFSINIYDIDRSVREIDALIKGEVYDKRLKDLNIARNQVIQDYNVFSMMNDICIKSQFEFKKDICLKTEKSFSGKSLIKTVGRVLGAKL